MTAPVDPDDRAHWMGLLARAPADRLAALWAATGLAPTVTTIRPAEVGSVMVRGRAGGSGAAFNLGEMTVTRATVRLDGGPVGHAWVQGRDKAQAHTAAVVDALMQTAEAPRLDAALLTPLAEEEEARRTRRARKAAATRVEFATLKRGEDP